MEQIFKEKQRKDWAGPGGNVDGGAAYRLPVPKGQAI